MNENLNQFGYTVKFNQYCESSHRERLEDFHLFKWSASYVNSVSCVSKTDKYPDVTSVYDIQIGHGAYLVWAEWDTGDSFGSNLKAEVEAFGLFTVEEDAYDFARFLESAKQGDVWDGPDDQTIEINQVSWSGFFESLSGVHVEFITISDLC